MRTFRFVLIGAALLLGVLALHYALPRVSVVEIVGVEVKRVDTEQGTRDVYIIQAQLIDGSEVRVFRNEDAFLYFKFESANLQARATALSRDEAVEAVAIRHYGWRISVLSLFPNAIAAWPVEAGYRHLPVFNSVIVGLLMLAGLLAWRAVRRARARVAAAMARRAEERAREAASRSAPSELDAEQEAWLRQDRPSATRSDDPRQGA